MNLVEDVPSRAGWDILAAHVPGLLRALSMLRTCTFAVSPLNLSETPVMDGSRFHCQLLHLNARF